MEAMTRWTDDRMDDLGNQIGALAVRTDEGFREVRTELRTETRELRAEMHEMRKEMNTRFASMNARFDSMDARFDSMNTRFDSMNARFDAMQRVMIMFGASMFAAMLGLIATQL